MAATATASSASVRYAPEDPSLPKPWRGLVDSKTGYLYFWNPETNVTQYERPASLAPPTKSSSVPISSSVQVQQSSQGQRRGYSPEKEDDRYGRSTNNGSKLEAGSRGNQSARAGPVQSHNAPNGAISGHGGSSTRGYGSSDAGIGLSAEAYRRRHEITVIGDGVPQPFTSFESTGFPSELLREVRYSLLEGANVVRCAALNAGALHKIWSALIWWTNLLEGLSESPKFMTGTAVGDDSVCHSVQMEEDVSSCSSLHQQALAGCLWRMMLLLELATPLLSPK
ncbi:hypothetical protein JRO89_XS01G0238200 [Xanthoceras sorbifolium]|uniref:WW domain-containing protein n=1 Tax=Xanthoceras sorbifolium TaxID=99658 RepID=A0ABQ8IKX0_9ROSI|nr:hypothetical protein JRO89_XS01G0238200 [Xanthoceras sorbifolium]